MSRRWLRPNADMPYMMRSWGLGPPPLVVGNLVDVLAVEPCRRCGVDVATLDEGFDKRIVAAQMRHEPQLDLRVIGRQQQMILIGGDERLRVWACQERRG